MAKSKLDKADGGLNAVRNELDALLDCLVAAGTVKRGSYDACLHRRRFKAVQKVFPSTGMQLTDTLDTPELVRYIGTGMGVRDVCRFSAASRVANTVTRDVTSERAHDKHLIVFDGERSFALFDPRADQWTSLPQLAAKRIGATLVPFTGRVYVCGGRQLHLYHPYEDVSIASCLKVLEGSWDQLHDMTDDHTFAVGACLQGHVYVCGGAYIDDVNGRSLYGPNPYDFRNLAGKESVDRFDPKTGCWCPTMPPMSIGRYHAVGVALNGCMYVCGGMSSNLTPLDSMEMFDPFLCQWKSLPQMLRCFVAPSRHEHVHFHKVSGFSFGADASCIAGCLYICGPSDYASGGSDFTVDRFDPAAGIWTELPAMKTRRCSSIALATCNDILYVFGGCEAESYPQRESNIWLNSVERYDPTLGEWEESPSSVVKGEDMKWPIAASAGDRLYVGGSCSSSMGVFNLKANRWQTLPAMPLKIADAGGKEATVRSLTTAMT